MKLRILISTILIATLLNVATTTYAAGSASLSASQIVARCRQSYDSLKSYACHTNVTAEGMGGSTYHTTAEIMFVRPGHIYASGLSMMGQYYAFYSDGATTQQFLLGSWQSEKSAEMAIAGATGIAQSAATTVPALLLHTQWGSPFNPAIATNPAVQTRSANGRPCYYILATGIENEAFWIDKKTFLLDQVATSISMGSIRLHQLQTITNQRLNPSVLASTFSAHTGG